MATFRNNTDKQHYFRLIFSERYTDRAKERYYFILKRSTVEGKGVCPQRDTTAMQ